MQQRIFRRRKFLISALGLGFLSIPVSAWVGSQRQQQVSAQIRQKQQTSLIEGILVPAQFQINITGETESAAFGPLPAVLEIVFPQAGDPNPLLIAVSMTAQTEADLGNGSIFWQSFSAGHPKQNEHFSRVTVSNGQVQMQVNPIDDSLRSDVMWFTQITGTLAEAMTASGGSVRSGVAPTTGSMTFNVNGNQVSGEMRLAGITDLGVSSTYQARFNGQR